MKTIFTTLLIALLAPFSLIALEDAHTVSRDAVSEIPELEHLSPHEIVEHAEAVLKHGEEVAVVEANKLVMIAEKFGVSFATLIPQMVNFVLVALALYYFAVKPVAKTLDERQQKIADGLQYAEEMKTQLAEAERERTEKVRQAAEEAQTILAEAREQSKEMIEKKTQEAAAQAEAIIRKASAATELERQKMLSDVRQEVARLVVMTSSKVLSRDLSDTEKQTFSESATRELASAGS